MILNKKIIVGIVLVLIVLGLVFHGLSSHPRISVHDLDWNDVERMNEHVSSMVLHIPPHFMNWSVGTHFDLTYMFLLFSENQDLLRDQPEVPGRRLESDFQVVLEFENLTGNETFLNEKWVRDTLNMTFYVDEYLADRALSLSSEAESAYVRAQNPHLFPEIIPLSQINWLDIVDDYKAHIEEISISRFYWRFHMEIFDFRVGKDELADIVHFLTSNSDSFIEDAINVHEVMDELFETGEMEDITYYIVQLIFRLPDSESRVGHARPESMFYI